MGFCEVSQKRVSPDFRRRHQDASAPRPDSAAPAGVKYALCSACLVAAFVILIWGMTFANTRALLEDFSALEILVGRFALAWAALWIVGAVQRHGARCAGCGKERSWR